MSTVDASGNLHDPAGRFSGHLLAEASVTVLSTDEPLVGDLDVADGLAMGLPGYRAGHRYALADVRSHWRARAAGMSENAFTEAWDMLVEAKRGECWASAISAELRTGGGQGLADLPGWVTEVAPQQDFELTYAEDFYGGPEDADYADHLTDIWTKRYMDAVLAMSGDSGMPATLRSA